MKSLESRAYILVICRPVFTSRFFGPSQFGGFLTKTSNWKDNKHNTGSPARFWQTRTHENNFTLSFLLLWGIVRRESPVSAGRQCCHTLTAGTRWTWLHKHRCGVSRLTIRACDWVSASAKRLPQSRHIPLIVKNPWFTLKKIAIAFPVDAQLDAAVAAAGALSAPRWIPREGRARVQCFKDTTRGQCCTCNKEFALCVVRPQNPGKSFIILTPCWFG